MYQQTRGWRHDYHNHIQTMKAHLAMGKSEELEAYLNELDTDLCLIIGNLIDNAIEACMRIEDEENRFIRIYIDILKGQLYIYVMNAVGEELKRIGNVYASTKNGENHGLGHAY